MAYRCEYRTLSGRYTFRFSIERQDDGDFHIYIEDQPSYCGRDSDGHSTHRYGVSSRPYICYDPMPTSREDAIEILKVWSDKTDAYIETGQTF